MGPIKEKKRNGVRVLQGGKIIVGILQKAERILELERELSVEIGYWIIQKGMMDSGDRMMIVLWWLRKGKDDDNNNNSNNNYLRVLSGGEGEATTHTFS